MGATWNAGAPPAFPRGDPVMRSRLVLAALSTEPSATVLRDAVSLEPAGLRLTLSYQDPRGAVTALPVFVWP